MGFSVPSASLSLITTIYLVMPREVSLYERGGLSQYGLLVVTALGDTEVTRTTD